MRSLTELADLTKGKIVGDASTIITGINDIRLARKGELSFLANPKYLKFATETQASALLVHPDQSTHPLPCPLIIVDNPSQAFASVAKLFTPPPIEFPPGIHPSAVIHDQVSLGDDIHIGPNVVIEAGASIASNTTIGANTYIGHHVSIGKSSFLYPNVTIRERSVIGSHVIIHPGAVIGADGFGYEFHQGTHQKIPQTGFVQIDDHVEIGANTTIDRGRFNKTWIQEGAKIDNLVMIAHNTVVGPHSIIVAQSGISGSTSLGAYVTIAGQVGTVGHINIGDQVTVTGRSAVTKDLAPKGVYRGAPARPIREQMKLEALIQKLPELYQRLNTLENQQKVREQ